MTNKMKNAIAVLMMAPLVTYVAVETDLSICDIVVPIGIVAMVVSFVAGGTYLIIPKSVWKDKRE